jgi:hypothetical protein
MMTTAAGIRLVPKRDRRPTLVWHIAEGWGRAFGTRATASDVARRWQIDQSTCEQLLDELTERLVLVAGTDGIYELARSK